MTTLQYFLAPEQSATLNMLGGGEKSVPIWESGFAPYLIGSLERPSHLPVPPVVPAWGCRGMRCVGHLKLASAPDVAAAAPAVSAAKLQAPFPQPQGGEAMGKEPPEPHLQEPPPRAPPASPRERAARGPGPGLRSPGVSPPAPRLCTPRSRTCSGLSNKRWL